MATTKKRINRHKLAVIQAYAIIALFVLFGLVAGFIVGRFTAPTKVETVTVTETVEVPTYDSSKLPEVGEITYYDIPLSNSLQRFIYEVCADEEVPVSLVVALIDHESKFNKFVSWDVPAFETILTGRIPAALLAADNGNLQPLKDLHIAT